MDITKNIKKYGCLNSLTLKLIAVITMLIDHTGAVLFPYNMTFRYIGRIAFPIYIFMLVEGFFHTRDVKKYALRLGIFVFLSEIPFDLAFSNTCFDWYSQNVFFTLFLGLLMLIFIKKTESYPWMKFVFLAGFMLAAYFLMTDYDAGGILLIFLFYILREKPWTRVIATAVVMLVFFGPIELFGLLAFIPIFLYNGKKGPDGRKMTENGPVKTPVSILIQYGFYAFYPVHLCILHLISLC